MSLNAATIEILIAKGLSASDIAELEAAAAYKAPPPPPLVRTSLPEAENARKGSTWRAKAYAALVERDGASCAECGAGERTIWRKAGYNTNEDWGRCEDDRTVSRFVNVNPSSNLEVDHIKPLIDGGSNDLSNLWLLCTHCHKKKTSAEHSARLKAMFAEARR